jgi:hypothetical protein
VFLFFYASMAFNNAVIAGTATGEVSGATNIVTINAVTKAITNAISKAAFKLSKLTVIP